MGIRRALVWAGGAAALACAAPALAQMTQGETIRDSIERLEDEVARADHDDTITEFEADGLRRNLHRLRDRLKRLDRNGLSPAEVQQLELGIEYVRRRLRAERSD